MKRSPLKHVVFDLDGTLISSMDSVNKMVHQIFNEYFDRKLSDQEIQEIYDVSFEKMLIKKQIDLSNLEWFIGRWNELNKVSTLEYNLFPNIKILLNKLKKDKVLLYIWTARDKVSTMKVLSKLKIKNHFTGISCFEDSKSKPDTEGIERLFENVDPKYCVVVGDSATDIIGANSFGAHSIAVTWCQNSNLDLLKASRPNNIVSEVPVCYELIVNYFKSLD